MRSSAGSKGCIVVSNQILVEIGQPIPSKFDRPNHRLAHQSDLDNMKHMKILFLVASSLSRLAKLTFPAMSNNQATGKQISCIAMKFRHPRMTRFSVIANNPSEHISSNLTLHGSRKEENPEKDRCGSNRCVMSAVFLS